jgi:glutamate--cysteine ligase catalytic subunit
MGVFEFGTPLPWDEVKKYTDHVRWHGITQFLHSWDRSKGKRGFELLWGDEIECMVIIFDDEKKNAKLSLKHDALEKLSSMADMIDSECPEYASSPKFHPEYGRYMIESIPGSPYTGSISDLLSVEANMRHRRHLLRKHLGPNEVLMLFSSFPRLGAQGQFTEPYYDPASSESCRSLFLPEEIMHPHVRYSALAANIRRRRDSKVATNVPIFFDTKTPRPFIDPTIPWNRSIYPEDSDARNGAALPDHIYMDAMGFGAGCCCMQVTLQAYDVSDARRLYDALIPVGPILLALTAASPIWRGYLADIDCRWNVIADSTDERTEEESGLKPLKNSRFRIPKRRYDSVDLYISDHWANRPEYNDIYAPYDEAIYNRLRENGIDEPLAKHFAHLFIRDPLVLLSEMIEQDDASSTAHFENMQSTIWQSLRFKPPSANSEFGWRVEFRTMDVQMTDFENAAFALFIVLLSRAIFSFNLTLYIPISKVDENMQRAHAINAVHHQKFYFRKNIFASGQSGASSTASSSGSTSPVERVTKKKDKKLPNCFPHLPRPENGFLRHERIEEEYEEMTLGEIMNGKGECFPGLLGLVYAYLDTLDIGIDEMAKIKKYLDFIRQRSNGELQTPATWMRNFVRSHPNYKFDSVVSQEINYDLVKAVDQIERGVRREPSLLPADYIGSE